MRLWVRTGVQINVHLWLFKDSWRHTKHVRKQSALPTRTPSSSQSVFRAPHGRKENTFQGIHLHHQSCLCCHYISTSRLQNVNPIPFQGTQQGVAEVAGFLILVLHEDDGLQDA